MKQKITIQDLENWNSCYTYEQHKKAFRGRKSLTPMQVCNMRSIPEVDRIWVLLHPEVIPERDLHLLACQFAEDSLTAERKAGREPDKRCWNAIKIKRLWIERKVTDEELFKAAYRAEVAVRASVAAAREAWAAASDAAWDAARAAARAAAMAARDAAWAAAREAAWAAARAAAWAAEEAGHEVDKMQLAYIREVVKRDLGSQGGSQ